jgi:hypothetical protein
MTCHTEAHIDGYFLCDDIAVANGSVADLARRACRSVHAMAEINERPKAIDRDPGDRRLLFGGGSEFPNVRTIGLDGLVTGHAKTLHRIRHEFTRIRILVTRIALQSKRQVLPMAIGKRLLLAR